MKKLVLALLITYSCISQNKNEIDIKGNWYTFSIKNVDTSYYTETFIDDIAFHSYDKNFGFKGSLEYLIKDGVLYYVRYEKNANKEKNIDSSGNIEIIDDNTISIHDEMIILKRIEDGLKLEDLLRNNASEEDYLKYFFQRKSKWEKGR